MDGYNFTVRVSWDVNFIGNISQYVVYISRTNSPTNYNGVHFADDEKYKIVSTL